FLEADLGGLVSGIAIGVPLHRQLAGGGFQLGLTGGAFDLKNLVVAALGHARIPPRLFRRGVVARSYLVTHGASKQIGASKQMALRNRWRFETDAPPAVTPGVLVAIDCRHRDRIAASGRFLVLLVVVDFGEFRVDHVLVLAGAIAAGSGTTGAFRPAGAAFLRLLVHRLAEFHRGLRQRVGLGRARIGGAALEGFLEIRHRILDGAALGFADLRAMLLKGLLGGVDQSLGVVLGLDFSLALLVLLGVGFGVLDHALDVSLGEAARRLDADLLFLAGALVLGLHVDDAVGVDVEGHLDLRNAARRRR